MDVDQPERPEASHEASTERGEDLQSQGHPDAARSLEDGAKASSSRSNATGRDKKADRAKNRAKGKAKQGENNHAGLSILEKLALSPYSTELHAEHVQSASSDEEKEEARAFMAQMVPLSEDLWLQWIHDRKAQVGNTLEGKVEVLELFKRACNDTFSLKLHQDYARYVLSIYFEARGYTFPDVLEEEEMSGQQVVPDESAAAVFDEEFVDGEMMAAVNRDMRWHLSQGQTVWLILHSYHLFRLRRDPSTESIAEMERFYLERLSEPHLQISDTFQMFSSFISTYKNTAYEESLVTSQPVYSATKGLVDLREGMEDQVSGSLGSVEKYQAYLAWEQEVSKPDFMLVKVLYQRAIETFPADNSLWLGYLSFLTTATKKPQSFAGGTDSDWTLDLLLETYQKASRHLPFSGEVLSECMRGIESLCPVEIASSYSAAQFERVMESNDPRLDLADIVSTAITRADIVRHAEMNDAESVKPSELLVSILQGAIAKVKVLLPETGDAHLRLEKYLLRQYERNEDWGAIDAFLAALAQSYPTSALILITRTDYLLRQNKVDTVRKLFQNAAKKRYDYPEFVFDAWAAFEHRDGTLSSLEKALATITHEMRHVNARRARESRLQQVFAEAAADSGTNGQEPSEVADRPKKRRLDEETPFVPTTNVANQVTTEKEMPAHEGSQDLKRDRENCTVSVTGLSTTAQEEDVRKLFRDCGPIREIKVRALSDQGVATVEFNSRESVPAALTKDKKRITGEEVHVSPVWKSTLYVTNFPETFDAADIQKLFEPYGPIFETRWPSRRLKATRRFVYIQYIDGAAAQRALALHDSIVKDGSDQRIQVHISDPQRKQTRTDANATKRELYVTGLPKQATESDLEKLFVPFGTLRGCRILKDDVGHCRGIGFVDFETEQSASAALSMNNYEYKKRRLGVVLADSRISQKAKPTASGQGQKADARSRSVRVLGLPANTEEPLLQQFFDRFGRTTSVEIQGSIATVIFEDAADAAKLVLSTSKLEFGNVELSIKEGIDRPQRKEHESGGNDRYRNVASFLPRANRGRGRKLGIGAARPTQNSMELDSHDQDAESIAATASDVTGSQPKRSQADFKAMLMGGSKA